jgi:hypothetical protein
MAEGACDTPQGEARRGQVVMTRAAPRGKLPLLWRLLNP